MEGINYYGIYKTVNNTWRETGPFPDAKLALSTTEFFAKGRKFKVITEEKFNNLLKIGKI